MCVLFMCVCLFVYIMCVHLFAYVCMCVYAYACLHVHVCVFVHGNCTFFGSALCNLKWCQVPWADRVVGRRGSPRAPYYGVFVIHDTQRGGLNPTVARKMSRNLLKPFRELMATRDSTWIDEWMSRIVKTRPYGVVICEEGFQWVLF